MTSTPPPPREGQRHTPGAMGVFIIGSPAGTSFRLHIGDVDIAHIPREWKGESNAFRLADSWNSCLPFPSPATDVPRLVEALRAVAHSDGFGDVPGLIGHEVIDVQLNMDTVRAVLAALPPEVRP